MPDDDADDRRLRLTDDADEPTDGRDDAEADEQGEGSRRSRRRREGKRRNPLVVALLVLLTMALIVAVALGGFALYLTNKFDNNVTRSSLLPDGDRATRAASAGNAQNILLLGSDSRTQELRSGARADVIQLVHVPNDRKSLQVIHFPRDLYVDIPGRGKNKINAAYAFGGAPLLVQTLEQLLGVRIDNVAAIGFDGFKELTNTVGGVQVNVDQPSTSQGYTFTPGTMQMNGDQALAFVRERKQLAGGDIDRGKRQQAWMKGLMSKTLNTGTLTNPVKLSGMVDDVSQNLVVDESFSTGDMRSLAFSMRGVRQADITFMTAPYSGFSSVRGIGSIDVVDEPRMKQLGQALQEDTMTTLPGQITNPG